MAHRHPLLLVLLLCSFLAGPVLAADVNATLGIDTNGLAGADSQNRVLLYTPNPVQSGSSISHWDRSAIPNLLMEPSVATNLPIGRADLTLALLEDIGWPRGNSNVVLRVQDAAGQGFNDPTLGTQRLQAMQFAADFWGNLLGSSVTINVDVRFADLTCDNNGAVLAQAGPRFLFHSFAGAGVANHWYPGALAEALSGQNLSQQDNSNPNAGDLRLTFNQNIDSGCLGGSSRFYYSTGNLPSGTLSFINVALHEMAHGLGFSSLVDETTGLPHLGRFDIFSRFLLDNTLGLHWHEMDAGQRMASAINTGHVVWDGSRVTQQAPNTLQPGPALMINSPASVAGRYLVGTSPFGPALSNPGINGDLVVALDASANPTLACGPLINGAAMQGRIALLDRGDCNFTVKVKNAQLAGARAVIIANNTTGGAFSPGGTDNTITIPSVGISRSDGQRLKAALQSSFAGTLAMAQGTVRLAEGAGVVNMEVERRGGNDGQVSVDYATGDGTATGGEDFSPRSGTVTFANGDSSPKSLQIPLLDDGLSEPLEDFLVTLSNVTGGADLGSPASTRVELTDDEPCLSSDTTICLLQDRFRLSLRWKDFANVTGEGRIIPADSESSALLYFFQQDNWEMLAKVIDGCGFNSHFWVFAAATTNVEYTLTVTDTLSGETRQYTNPLGQSSAAITDTAAFATCP